MGNTPSAPCAATVLAAAALLSLPALVRAQPTDAPSHKVVGSTQPPSVSPTPKQVEVSVDWLDIPETDISTTNVGPGPNHDGRLMAALIQNGAVDTKGPTVMTTDGVFGSIHMRTDVPTVVTVKGKPQKTALHLDDFIEVTPHINPDGSVAVMGGVQRQTLIADSDPAAASTDFLPFTLTASDDNTFLVNGNTGGFGSPVPKHYVFMTVKTVPVRAVPQK